MRMPERGLQPAACGVWNVALSRQALCAGDLPVENKIAGDVTGLVVVEPLFAAFFACEDDAGHTP